MENSGTDFGGFKLDKKPGGTLKPRVNLAESLQKRFPFSPTPGQSALFEKISAWLVSSPAEPSAFVLKGYAGTGKTAFLSALVKVLPQIGMGVQLLAPTGRASKVMAGYTRKMAFTIHRRIFSYELGGDGIPRLKRQKNSFSKTLFVVDEASMVSNQSEYGTRGVLEELVRYVFENTGNRLLLIGDLAQLPPVGTDLSLALKKEELASRFGLRVLEHELTEVVRQQTDSGILENATALREVIRGQTTSFLLQTAGRPDVFKMKANRVAEGIQYAYDRYGMERTLVVTRTNKQALNYNRMIRGHILYREEELEVGDWIIVVKNNYSVVESDSRLGFLANGDLARVKKVRGVLEEYPIRLIKTELSLDSAEEEEVLECLCTADLLYADQPQLPEEKIRAMQEFLLQEWESEELDLKKRLARLKSDPLANAVQIKFGYALTCHKAQGGQWDAVFVDHGYLKEGNLDPEFYRWLYTAITRAREQLFFVEPDSRLLSGWVPSAEDPE